LPIPLLLVTPGDHNKAIRAFASALQGALALICCAPAAAAQEASPWLQGHYVVVLLALCAALILLCACVLLVAALLFERSRRLRRLEAETDHARELLEASGFAFYRIRGDGSMSWSRNAAEVLAAGEKALPSRLVDWLACVEASQREGMRKRYADLLEGRPGGTRDITVRHAQGAQLACEDTATSVRSGRRGAREVLGLLRNTTGLIALETELKQARPIVSVGRIAGTIAHDLANVLSIIHGHSQVLAASTAQAHSGRLTSAIMAAADRGQQLCHQILFIARPRAARESVTAGKLVQELRTMLSGLAATGVVIETSVDQGELVVQCNAGRLLQALLNLCINALEAMKEEGGTLAIRCSHVANEAPFPGALGMVPVGSFLCFEISDTGEGIPPNELSRIFDAGYTTKKGEAPRGLGLAIIASVLSEVGAFLDVESRAAPRAAGTGTTFRIYVPCPASAAREGTLLPSAKLGLGESILIMDFDEESLLRMEDMVAGIGYEPNAFSDCEEAMRSARENDAYRAAIVASNVTLADGTPFYDVLARHIPAFRIVLLASNDRALPTAAMPALVQPFTHAELGAVLAKVVNR
jgi:signal transduction histidine kinase